MITTRLSLLQNAARDPADSWSEFHNLYRPFIITIVGRLISNCSHADAEDVTQEIMKVLHARLPAFIHTGPGSFRAYLREITRRQSLNWLQKQGRIGDPSVRKHAATTTESWNLDDLAAPNSSLSRLWNFEHQIYWCNRVLEEAETRFRAKSHSTGRFQLYRRVRIQDEDLAEVAAELGIPRSSAYRTLFTIDRIVGEILREWKPFIDPDT